MSPFFRKISDGARSLRKGQLLENGRFTRTHRTVCIRIASGSGDTHCERGVPVDAIACHLRRAQPGKWNRRTKGGPVTRKASRPRHFSRPVTYAMKLTIPGFKSITHPARLEVGPSRPRAVALDRLVAVCATLAGRFL